MWVVLFLYGGTIEPDAQVTGTWDARFVGKVHGKETRQDDDFVMELTQNGSVVKGTLRFKGLEVSFPLTGKTKGTIFTYSAKGNMGPNCEATVTGEITVDQSAGQMEGSQTQSNCEGTAEGRVTAVRR